MSDELAEPVIIKPFEPTVHAPLFILTTGTPRTDELVVDTTSDDERIDFFVVIRIPSSLYYSGRGRGLRVLRGRLLCTLGFAVVRLGVPLPVRQGYEETIETQKGPRKASVRGCLPLLRSASLFTKVSTKRLHPLLDRLKTYVHDCNQNRTLIRTKTPDHQINIILAKDVRTCHPTPNKTQVPVARVKPKNIFNSILNNSDLSDPIAIITSTPYRILLFPCRGLLRPSNSTTHRHLLRGLIQAVDSGCFLLSHQISLLIVGALQTGVYTCLLDRTRRRNDVAFAVPFSHVRLTSCLGYSHDTLSQRLDLVRQSNLLSACHSDFGLLRPRTLQRVVLWGRDSLWLYLGRFSKS